MNYIDKQFLEKLHKPAKDSHKGENGKLMIIGGSHLFHGASLWALTVASRIVDMVYYASVAENLELTKQLKQELYAFIAVPYGKEADYLNQADCVLIGPGMVRGSSEFTGTGENGDQTREKTLQLIKQFPQKQWLIDAGAVQAVKLPDLSQLKLPIITPHRAEFERLFEINLNEYPWQEQVAIVKSVAEKHQLVIVVKGAEDIIASPDRILINRTGNEGMTKGGTGDVLAGLIAALSCTNDPFIAAAAGTYINGLAGDTLYGTVGPYFNADELAIQVPKTLWQELPH